MTSSPGRICVALSALMLGGCSHFISHEQAFPPIVPMVGDMRVSGKDTVYLLRAPSYEVVARTRTILDDTRHSLDDASRNFSRYFGEPIVPVHVVVSDSA